MSALKGLLRGERARALLVRLAAAYIRLVWRTGRWVILDSRIPARFWDSGRPIIVAFWHGRLLMMPFAWQSTQPFRMLISQHRDGQLIADVVAGFNIGALRGSTRHGAGQALRDMVRALKAGESVGITPDGPRGPAERAADGAIAVARLTDVPVLPLAYSAAPARRLGSWDGFLLPLPFCRGVICWGEPIEVPPIADQAVLEACRARLEAALLRLTQDCDRLTGRRLSDVAAARA